MQSVPAPPGETQRDGEPPRIYKRELAGEANGTAEELDEFAIERMTLVGNGVVPAVAAKAFLTLYEEMGKKGAYAETKTD